MFHHKKGRKKSHDAYQKVEKGKSKRGDRYNVLFDIGAGGQAQVFVAEDLRTKEPVAIKRYPLRSPASANKTEITYLKRLRRQDVYSEDNGNKYVIEFKEAFCIDRSLDKHDKYELWIVQEFCECGDLFHVMKRLGRPFSCLEIKHILANVLLGLRFIHSRKIVHRDLKCLNILLTRSGRVKICDFGHAERVDYDSEHNVIESKATDCWMAPEMFKDGAYYGYEVDIWALGVCLIEMSKMRPPFDDQYGDMVASQVLNLPALRLEQQRELLGLDRPPLELTERCTSQRNNYWNFYTEEFKFLEMENDFDFDNSDIKKKHLSVHTAGDISGEDSDDEIYPEGLSVKSFYSESEGSNQKKRQALKSTIRKRNKKGSKKLRNNKRGSDAPNVKAKSTFKSGQPLSINIPRRRKQRKSVKHERKKHSLVTELFNIRNSFLRRSKKRGGRDSKTKHTKTDSYVNRNQTRYSDVAEDYVELIKESEDVIFTEFAAWCLHTEQSKRPNVFDLLAHPFIEREVKHLTKCNKTECSILEHSDFLLRSNILQATDIRAEDADDIESDDDCFLTEEEQQKEIFNHVPEMAAINEVCTCSKSQAFIREAICDEFLKLTKQVGGRRSKTKIMGSY